MGDSTSGPCLKEPEKDAQGAGLATKSRGIQDGKPDPSEVNHPQTSTSAVATKDLPQQSDGPHTMEIMEDGPDLSASKTPSEAFGKKLDCVCTEAECEEKEMKFAAKICSESQSHQLTAEVQGSEAKVAGEATTKRPSPIEAQPNVECSSGELPSEKVAQKTAPEKQDDGVTESKSGNPMQEETGKEGMPQNLRDDEALIQLECSTECQMTAEPGCDPLRERRTKLNLRKRRANPPKTENQPSSSGAKKQKKRKTKVVNSTKTKYFGVYANGKKGFKAQMHANGLKFYYGTFPTAKGAARVYNKHALEHGKQLNDISEDSGSEPDVLPERNRRRPPTTYPARRDAARSLTARKQRSGAQSTVSASASTPKRKRGGGQSSSAMNLEDPYGALKHGLPAGEASIVRLARTISLTAQRENSLPIYLRDIISPNLLLEVISEEDLMDIVRGFASNTPKAEKNDAHRPCDGREPAVSATNPSPMAGAALASSELNPPNSTSSPATNPLAIPLPPDQKASSSDPSTSDRANNASKPISMTGAEEAGESKSPGGGDAADPPADNLPGKEDQSVFTQQTADPPTAPQARPRVSPRPVRMARLKAAAASRDKGGEACAEKATVMSPGSVAPDPPMNYLPDELKDISTHLLRTLRSFPFLEDVDLLEEMLVEMAIYDTKKLEKSIQDMPLTNGQTKRKSNAPELKFDTIEDMTLKDLRSQASCLGVSAKGLTKKQLSAKILGHLHSIFSVPADSQNPPAYRIAKRKPPRAATSSGGGILANAAETADEKNNLLKRPDSFGSLKQNPVRKSRRQLSSCAQADNTSSEAARGIDRSKSSPGKRSGSRRKSAVVFPGKKPKTSFNFFQMEQRSILVKECEAKGTPREKIHPFVSKTIASKWRGMTSAQKAEYEAAAARDRVAYSQRKKEFESRFSLPLGAPQPATAPTPAEAPNPSNAKGSKKEKGKTDTAECQAAPEKRERENNEKSMSRGERQKRRRLQHEQGDAIMIEEATNPEMREEDFAEDDGCKKTVGPEPLSGHIGGVQNASKPAPSPHGLQILPPPPAFDVKEGEDTGDDRAVAPTSGDIPRASFHAETERFDRVRGGQGSGGEGEAGGDITTGIAGNRTSEMPLVESGNTSAGGHAGPLATSPKPKKMKTAKDEEGTVNNKDTGTEAMPGLLSPSAPVPSHTWEANEPQHQRQPFRLKDSKETRPGSEPEEGNHDEIATFLDQTYPKALQTEASGIPGNNGNGTAAAMATGSPVVADPGGARQSGQEASIPTQDQGQTASPSVYLPSLPKQLEGPTSKVFTGSGASRPTSAFAAYNPKVAQPNAAEKGAATSKAKPLQDSGLNKGGSEQQRLFCRNGLLSAAAGGIGIHNTRRLQDLLNSRYKNDPGILVITPAGSDSGLASGMPKDERDMFPPHIYPPGNPEGANTGGDHHHNSKRERKRNIRTRELPADFPAPLLAHHRHQGSVAYHHQPRQLAQFHHQTSSFINPSHRQHHQHLSPHLPPHLPPPHEHAMSVYGPSQGYHRQAGPITGLRGIPAAQGVSDPIDPLVPPIEPLSASFDHLAAAGYPSSGMYPPQMSVTLRANPGVNTNMTAPTWVTADVAARTSQVFPAGQEEFKAPVPYNPELGPTAGDQTLRLPTERTMRGAYGDQPHNAHTLAGSSRLEKPGVEHRVLPQGFQPLSDLKPHSQQPMAAQAGLVEGEYLLNVTSPIVGKEPKTQMVETGYDMASRNFVQKTFSLADAYLQDHRTGAQNQVEGGGRLPRE